MLRSHSEGLLNIEFNVVLFNCVQKLEQTVGGPYSVMLIIALVWMIWVFKHRNYCSMLVSTGYIIGN